ncbi:MAG: DUF1343 domain-containing protein [Tannerella sp.]|jgi:uncharacterized protein YbbC (DUF1343 family)|nr:DUF1343 domain-containing protein [Tannerella sp.]
MKNIIQFSVLSFVFLFLTIYSITAQDDNRLFLGADRMDTIKAVLKDKRVGLVVNQTSILSVAPVHLIDTLLAQGIRVTKVFAPEHGFRGTLEPGTHVESGVDSKTGIPIESAYGNNNRPTESQLNGIDVLVFDIQDVGTRFYTYISTMHYMMDACAEYGKAFVVLDRPNPNDYVDGPMRKAGFESFVGVDPIPVLHGLTVGELAQMIHGEGWLKSEAEPCNLTVVKMLNWKHGDPYTLPVRPSPNLPNPQAIRLYPSLCFFEGLYVSVGRGTEFPFQILGCPDKRGGSFTFTPVVMPGFDINPMHKNTLCYGIDLRDDPFEGGLSLQYVIDFFNRLGRDDKLFFTRPNWFDLLAGNSSLRKQIVQGLSEAEIRASWQPDLNQYKAMRKKYLLYPDYGLHSH